MIRDEVGQVAVTCSVFHVLPAANGTPLIQLIFFFIKETKSYTILKYQIQNETKIHQSKVLANYTI